MPESQDEIRDKAIFQSGIILFLLSCIFLALGVIGMLLSGDGSGLYAGGHIQYISRHALSLLIVGVVLCGVSVYMIFSKRPQT